MKNKALKALSALILASITAVTCYAATPSKPAKSATTKPMLSIVGNPLGRKDNYTINSKKETNVNVECLFINTGKKPAELDIWTTPNTMDPNASVHLKSGSNSVPFQLIKRFHLNLKKQWWCRIYTPHKKIEKWNYCSYFSISDATITRHNPFSTWNKTIRSKDSSYHCRIKKPNHNVSFFYFKIENH